MQFNLEDEKCVQIFKMFEGPAFIEQLLKGYSNGMTEEVDLRKVYMLKTATRIYEVKHEDVSVGLKADGKLSISLFT